MLESKYILLALNKFTILLLTIFRSLLIEKYKDKFGKDSNIAGLSIIKMDENNKTIEKYSLFKDFIEKRIDLESKNRNFNNLHKCFVTNQVISKNT